MIPISEKAPCCCECCPQEPTGLRVTFQTTCPADWNSNPVDASWSPEFADWRGAFEANQDCGANWVFSIRCDCSAGIYYFEMEGIGTEEYNYGLRLHCGPSAHTLKRCGEDFRLEWEFTCGDCCGDYSLKIIAVPIEGSMTEFFQSCD
jgi:hypothetical protein